MFQHVSLPAEDVGTRMALRTLLQFRQSPVFQAVLSAFAGELQALLDACAETLRLRAPADAVGDPLDVLGRIVGQGRELFDWSVFVWFTPDTEDKGKTDKGSVAAWVLNAPFGESLLADDGLYRNLIEGKVSRNHCQYGSVPEIQDAVKKTFGIDVSVVWVAPLIVKLVVPDGTSENIKNFLMRQRDSKAADNVYFLPLPATVLVSEVVELSTMLPS